MTKKQADRNSRILSEIFERQRAATEASEKLESSPVETKETDAWKRAQARLAAYQEETSRMEAEFLAGTIKLKTGKKQDSEDILASKRKNQEKFIVGLEKKLADQEETIRFKELELEQLKLVLRLNRIDYAKRIAQTRAKMAPSEDEL